MFVTTQIILLLYFWIDISNYEIIGNPSIKIPIEGFGLQSNGGWWVTLLAQNTRGTAIVLISIFEAGDAKKRQFDDGKPSLSNNIFH